MEVIIPGHWKEVKLGAICLKPEYGWTTAAALTGTIRYLRTTDISKNQFDWATVPFCENLPTDISQFLLKEGDILITRTGSIGESYFIEDTPPFEVVFASYLIRLRPVLVHPKYVYYYTLSPYYQEAIKEIASGSAVQNINATTLSGISFPLAPFKEQAAIIKKLDAFFVFLSTRQELLRKTETAIHYLRQSALQKAITGELTKGWREENIQKTEILNKENAQNALPPSWILSSIYSVYYVNPPFLNNISDDTLVSFIPMSAVEEETGRIDLSLIRKYSEVKKGYTKFQEGDLLFAKITPSMQNGKYAVARNLKNGVGCGTTEFHVFREKELGLNDYLRLFLLQEDIRLLAEEHFEGSTGFQRVPLSFFKKIIFPLPTLREQGEIVDIVESYFAAADRLQESCEILKKEFENLRKSVLHQAFCGELSLQQPDDETVEMLLTRVSLERTQLELSRIDLRKKRQEMSKEKSKKRIADLQKELSFLLREQFNTNPYNSESLDTVRSKISIGNSSLDFEKFADIFGELISSPLEKDTEPLVNTHYENGQIFYTNNFNRII